MEFKLTIDMDNSAFDEQGGPLEVARILRELSELIPLRFGKFVPMCSGYLRDQNGNAVGSWGVTDRK